MADHQRIHPDPVTPTPDLESNPKPATPSAPLGSSTSENCNPTDPNLPYLHTIPPQHSKPPKKRNYCRRCLCGMLCLVILLVTFIGILAAILYFKIDPKLPKYSVDGITITRFNFKNDNTLSAQFNVKITARNPNSKIGISYEGGSKLTVIYMGTTLCEGSFPEFYQGHKNTTVLDIPLTGQTQDGSGLLGSLQAQQQTGTVPLVLRVKVPVRIKVGKLKLPKWMPLVRCRVNVDTLAANNVFTTRDSTCSFRFNV